MKNTRTRKIIGLALTVLLLAAGLLPLTGCRNAMQPPEPYPPESEAATGYLSLTIGRTRARALANIEIDGFDDLVFDLYLEHENPVNNLPPIRNWDGDQIGGLVPGQWTLAITALRPNPAGDDLFAVAQTLAPVGFQVASGQTTDVAIAYLFPVPVGDGWFSWQLTFYLDGNASITVRDLGGVVFMNDLYISSGAYGYLELEAGQYRAYLTLRHEGESITISRIINVYAGMTSHWAETFTPEDLHRPFLYYFLDLWNGSSWDLSWVQQGHLDILREEEGIQGLILPLIAWFNDIYRLPLHPGYNTAADLRMLVDATLVEIGAGDFFADEFDGEQSDAEDIIRDFAWNGTGITFAWLEFNTVVATIGSRYSVGIAVHFPIPTFPRENYRVPIQGGTFLMGSPGNFYEEPLREVTLSGFYMSRFQVTQGEWYDVMGSNPSYFNQGNSAIAAAGANWRNLPVEQVSWYDARVFSNRLSIQRGLTPAYRINGSTNPDDWGPVPNWDAVEVVPGSTGYRLPTEAQWEFAARGGVVCQGNFIFSRSDNADEVAWHSGNSGSRTHEVGTRQPNALGLYDMSGNVWEWAWDWFDTYPNFPETDPTGAGAGSFRVFRGGGWSSPPEYTRSAVRGGSLPVDRSIFFGFRLVRPFPPLQGTVSITGIPQMGQTLTADTTNLGGSGAISFQWRRGGVNVGTNSDTYVVQADDLGYTITVTVIRADNSGSYTSPAVGPVIHPGMIARRFDGRDGTRFTNDNWPAGRVNGFDYEAWTDIRGAEGFVMYIYTDGSFRGTWNQTYDTLFRVGRRWPGNVSTPTTFPTVNDVGNISLRHRTTSFTSTNGATYLTVYGWAFDGNQQIEFYIIDSWRNWAPVYSDGSARSGYTHHGSFQSGGYTWDVVTGWRLGQPALTGQAVDFLQIFSVRRGSQVTGGTGARTSVINVSDHFNRWITNVPAQTHSGTTINFTGSSRLYEVMWCVEGFGGMAGSSGVGIVTELCIIYGNNRVCTNPSTCPRC